MYRAYARDRQARVNLGIRRRLAPLMGNDRRKIELMNGLLFSMPGTPVVYYGDELGMGDNIYLGDRDGVRTPMQWSSDRNAGFSRANPQQLYLPTIIDPEYHFETVNVEAQRDNPHSLLWWTKRLIALRKQHRVFGRGELDFLHPENSKVLAFVRHSDDERVLVVANLSRHAQYVELDLSAFKGVTPVELFGGTEFPPVGDLPYLLTLAPYQFYWMLLEQKRGETVHLGGFPTISLTGGWESIYRGRERARLERALPAYLRDRRWFGGKARTIRSVEIDDLVQLPAEPGEARTAVLFVRVAYREGEPDVYVLPVSIARHEAGDRIESEIPHAVIAHLERREERAVLYDAAYDARFASTLLDLVMRRRRVRGDRGRLQGQPTRAMRRLVDGHAELEPSLYRTEQSNSSITYGDRLILKLFRRLDEGVNPDLEIGRFLTEQVGFEHIPALAGALERHTTGEPATVAIVQELVANEGDAWRYTLDVLGRFYEDLLAGGPDTPGTTPVPTARLAELAEAEPPDDVVDLVGTYLESADRLGRRTAEMHAALAAGGESAFAPESFSVLYQRSLFQGMRAQARRVLPVLRRALPRLDGRVADEAREVLASEEALLDRFQAVARHKLDAMRIRTHGDFHLGQVLYTGRDFVIIDFEGEPARAVSERRIKRCPLRDVAGMLRSYDYAADAARAELVTRGVVDPDSDAFAALAPWGEVWRRWVGAVYLRAYLEEARPTGLLPDDPADLTVLLDAYVLEKAVYELGYELNNRPDWVGIPLRGILELLQAPS
ncbi:MAG TPA: putative maltokinase, partial [Acidimicrobiia bacterium]|nr:putative maltokinase [Acidimicrobiia bacterium]